MDDDQSDPSGENLPLAGFRGVRVVQGPNHWAMALDRPQIPGPLLGSPQCPPMYPKAEEGSRSSDAGDDGVNIHGIGAGE